MNNKKAIFFSMSVILLSIASLLIIRQSNDHSECDVIIETRVSEDGLTKVTTTKHSCNENFNL